MTANLCYYDIRDIDPKYSRRLSGEPALGEYISGSDAGSGGIYDHFNFNLYHYAGIGQRSDSDRPANKPGKEFGSGWKARYCACYL